MADSRTGARKVGAVLSQAGRRAREWDDFALVDPYWGVVTMPENKYGQGGHSEFFAQGEAQVRLTLAVAERLGRPAARRTALDFGCGLGRLTRALATRFVHTYGVDVSGALVEQARTLNASVPNCDFQVLTSGGLEEFSNGSIDLVYSMIVLQHQAHRAAIRSYLSEFVRLLAPGGLAVFQIPTHIPLPNRLQPRRRLYSGLRALGVSPGVLYRRLRLDPLRMIHMPRDAVIDAVNRAGGVVIHEEPDMLGGRYPSTTYYATCAPN